MTSNTKNKTKMNAKSSNISTSFAGDPEDNKMLIGIIFKELAFVYGANTKLALDGRNQRRALEDSTGEGFESSSDLRGLGDRRVETGNADILLASALLRLDQARGTINTDDEVARDLRVQCSGMAGLLGAEEALDPSDDLVGRRVGGFVKVDDTIPEILSDGAL